MIRGILTYIHYLYKHFFGADEEKQQKHVTFHELRVAENFIGTFSIPMPSMMYGIFTYMDG